MPYKNPAKQREYKREWQRAKRRETQSNPEDPDGTLIRVSKRLDTPDDVLAVLAEQVDALRRDRRLKTVERAKAIAQLGALCLKVIETRDVVAQVTDLHSVLGGRALTGRRAA